MEADTGSPEGVLRRSGDCGMVLFTASASPESIGSDVKSTHETFWRRKGPDAYGTSGKGRCFLPL